MATLAHRAEHVELPGGTDERLAGYGVMGLPFASGHVLAMRRFPASSIGPAYTSVWHRSPDDEWTFWQDQPSERGCGRYFSSGLRDLTETEVHLSWPAPDQLRLEVPAVDLVWRSRMAATPSSKAFNVLSSLVPDRAWRSPRLLGAVGPIAGRLLGMGRIGLTGRAPNGQQFLANPQRIWFIVDAEATLAGADLGPLGPLASPAALGDFVLPGRGVFALGSAFFR